MKKYLKVFIIFSLFFSFIACKNTNNSNDSKKVEKEFFRVTVTPISNGKITVKTKKDSKILKESELKQIEKDTELEVTLEASNGYTPVKLVIGKNKHETVVDNKIVVAFKLKENTVINGQVEKLQVSITVASDSKAQVASPNITVDKNSKWQEVKEKITITYTEGWTLEGWHFDNKNGALIEDSYLFTENKTVFACTKKIEKNFKVEVTQPANGKITVKKVISQGNEVELNQDELLAVLEDTNLKIELEANDKTTHTPVELKVGNTSFNTVQENKISHYFTINQDIAISGKVSAYFKITKNNVENGAITIEREHGGTLTPVFDSELNKVLEGKELTIKLSANAGYKVKSLSIKKEKLATPIVVTETNAQKNIETKITVDDNIILQGEVEKDNIQPNINKIEIDLGDNIKFNMIEIPELTTPTKLCGQEGVILSAYQLSETEVPQALYQKVMGKNPTTTEPAPDNEKPKCPVSGVSFYDVVAFCNELTILSDSGDTKNCTYYTDEEKTIIYRKADAEAKKYPYIAWQKKGFRLPTEAEWERGAFGKDAKKYPGSDTPDSVAWYDVASFTPIHHNVATKAANDYGLYDMAGNVAEWVWDPYITSDERKNNPITKNPTYKHRKSATGSLQGVGTIRGGDYTCCSAFATTPLMCNSRDSLTCQQLYDSIDGFDTGIRIARGAFNIFVKVTKLTIDSYELTKEELDKAKTSEGFKKEFEKGNQNVQIVVDAEAGATITFEEGSNQITLNSNYQKVVIKVTKEEFVSRVLTLYLSKKEVSSPSSIVNGTKKDYPIGSTGVNIKMVSIAPVDDVTLGSTDKSDNKPHKVSLSGYQISETEVTQKVYQAVTGENPSYFTESKKVAEDEQELRPVDQVLWYEAVAFCNMLTTQVKDNSEECVYYNDEALTEVYTMEHAKRDTQAINQQGGSIPKTPYVAWEKKGFRLPTEAEWEWASFGGENGKYSGSQDLLAVAWCGDNATKIGDDYVTRQVAKKLPNGFGLFDMTGNVFEWCGEWRVNDVTPLGGKDPKGQQTSGGSKYKVQRSSSYGLSSHEKHESTHRDWNDIFSRSKTSGIRLVSRLF